MSTRRKQPQFAALASDGDGTLTRGGHMGVRTRKALEHWRSSGRKVFLTTGETVEDLADFPHLDLFDLVIAENGALLFDPATGKKSQLCKRPTPRLLRELKRKGIKPLDTGRVIISTEFSQERPAQEVLNVLRSEWRQSGSESPNGPALPRPLAQPEISNVEPRDSLTREEIQALKEVAQRLVDQLTRLSDRGCRKLSSRE